MKPSVFILLLLLSLPALSCEETLRQRPSEYFTMGDPVERGSRYSNLWTDNTGKVFMSWLLRVEDNLYALQYADFDSLNWGETSTVRIGEDFFVNWADFPSVVSLDGEPVAFHWLRQVEGGPHAYHIDIAFRDESGRWSNIVTPHLDGTPTEHGFVSMAPLSGESVVAVWLDGRQTEGRSEEGYDDPDHAMTIRSAEVHADGRVERQRVIDSMVCDCCPTGMVREGEELLLVYRGRTDGEVRDILIARYDISSGEWSEPVSVYDDGWEIAGCPVNGPRIDSRGDLVAVAWFTAAGEEPQVRLALSRDGGESFESPVQINRGTPLGRVDVKIGPDGRIYVSWLERMDENFASLELQQVDPLEGLQKQYRIATADMGRGSGTPRMTPARDGLILTWTQTEPLRRTRNAWVPWERFEND
ncbi:MAG: hypothetical protein WDZ29_05910 [Balneolaceae bacterium]